jgi:hypothetical protein
MNLLKTSLLLITLLSQLSWAGLNEKQREVLPFLKAMNGVKTEGNLENLSPLIQKYSIISKKVAGYSFIKDNDCQLYQLSRTKLNEELFYILNEIVDLNRSDNELHTFLKTRFEMILNYSLMLSNFAANGAEGGIKTLSDKKKTCLKNNDDRKLWLEDMAKAEILIKKIKRKIFGIRTFYNLHESSVFYAQRVLDDAIYEKNKFFILTGASLIILPLASYYLPLAMANATTRLGLGAQTVYRAKITYNALTVVSMGYTGAMTAEVFLKMEKELIFQKQKQTYKAINQLIDADIESPQLYFDFEKQIVGNLKVLFDDLIKNYGPRYQKSLTKCIDSNDDVNCHKKWHLYL